jgi:beta-phosphoglucomutase
MPAAIFDVDGVLIDSYQAHFQSWARLCAELDIPFDEPTFLRGFGRTNRDIFDELAPGRFTPQEVAVHGARKEAHYREIFAAQPTLVDGAAELIDALAAAGFKLAVGSSGPPENVALALEKLGRGAKLSAIVNGADVTRGKPDPQVFLMAAERLGVSPADCAVIEDAAAGVEAANRAGMTSIALVGTTTRDKLSHARLVVDRLHELSPARIAELIGKRR